MIILVVAWGQHHHRIMPGLSSFPTIHQIQIPAESNTRNIFLKKAQSVHSWLFIRLIITQSHPQNTHVTHPKCKQTLDKYSIDQFTVLCTGHVPLKTADDPSLTSTPAKQSQHISVSPIKSWSQNNLPHGYVHLTMHESSSLLISHGNHCR